MEDWTTDELVVAAISMQHDLRGSWNGDYSGRIHELRSICDAIYERENAVEDRAKKEFVDKLNGNPDLSVAALNDIGVCNAELENIADGWFDGRIFRNAGAFYDMTLPEAGKTDQVIEFLTMIAECDDWHWFQK